MSRPLVKHMCRISARVTVPIRSPQSSTILSYTSPNYHVPSLPYNSLPFPTAPGASVPVCSALARCASASTNDLSQVVTGSHPSIDRKRLSGLS